MQPRTVIGSAVLTPTRAIVRRMELGAVGVGAAVCACVGVRARVRIIVRRLLLNNPLDFSLDACSRRGPDGAGTRR